jgi:transcriptional regulator with XRE-family HTH domain
MGGMINNRIRIGSRLRELREAQGLTTTQLGERCGLTQSTISKVENGKWSVSLDILSKICEALGARVEIV